MTAQVDPAAAAMRAYQRLMELAQSDPEVGATMPDEAVTAALKEPGKLYRDAIATALSGYSGRKAFGTRAWELRRDSESGRMRRHYLPAFSTITYGEIARQVEAVASAWQRHPVHGARPGEFVCFIAFTSAQMAIVDMACAYAGTIAVPLQANLPAADIMEVFADTEPAVLVATMENLELAAGYALRVPSVRSLVVIDVELGDDEERERVEAARRQLDEAGGRIVLATFDELVEFGAQAAWTPSPPHPDGPDALTMLMYTSGSTGTPKGAMIHDAMCANLFAGMPMYQPQILLAYAPLNHFMGRASVFGTLAQGGVVSFTLKSDMSSLFEDIRIVRPTFVMFMPRVAEITWQAYQSDLQQRIAAGEDPQAADAAVRAEMRGTWFGDRVLAGGAGGAPTSPEVQAFMRECFDIAFSDGYSSTEISSSGVIGGGRVMRQTVIDYKLIDVPELGYYTTDKPFPRGEFLVKSRFSIKGYFKRPEATAQIFDEEGWLHTGDIMEERGPDQLRWLDRRNNVIKLSQAEFVAVGPLESTYLGNSELIRQIYIYGSSYRSYLLAVAVPDTAVAAARLGHEASPEELRLLVLADLQEAARKAALKSFEVPRDVLIELEPFTYENGLLSSVRKPLRPKLKERYQDALEAMYQEMDRARQEELAQLRQEGSGLSTVERVAGAIRASLGLAELDPDSSQGFGDLGGDSLGAVSFSLLLEEMFGVEVPVSVILSPTASAARLARFIENQKSAAQAGFVASFASVHGEGATKLRAADLTLDAFLDAAALEAAEQAEPPAGETRHVLLTGATGFLGRFLCLEWLEHLVPRGGKVTCIVRASDASDARRRLDEAFGTLDGELAAHFRELAGKGLEVIAGDLAAPRLGLDEETFSRLAAEVDQIVHPGALVNHVLTYRNLFEPNVLGTAELIRLALTSRIKRFDYVSTFGVPQMHAGLVQAPESIDIRQGAPDMVAGDGYAQGYGASKWASEVLLREANEHFGLPVTVYRPDMIMPHSRYRGQINVPDMLTRLLFSLVQSGVAPETFYEREADGSVARVHYDGLPVDFLAHAMLRLGSQPWSGFRTFNTISAHVDDGVSLDTIAGWIESAGYPLQRLADHGEWLRRFTERLRNLSEEQRQHSSLGLLAYVERPQPAHGTKVRNDDFVSAVGEVPHISEAYIHKYLDDMRQLALLPSAP